MNRMVTVLRVVFGLMLMAFSLSWAWGVDPPEVNERAVRFREAMFESGFAMHAIFITQGLVGLSWLTNRLPALGSLALLPVTIGVVLFHVVLIGDNGLTTLLLVVPNIFMLWVCRRAYSDLLRLGTIPSHRTQARRESARINHI